MRNIAFNVEESESQIHSTYLLTAARASKNHLIWEFRWMHVYILIRDALLTAHWETGVRQCFAHGIIVRHSCSVGLPRCQTRLLSSPLSDPECLSLLVDKRKAFSKRSIDPLLLQSHGPDFWKWGTIHDRPACVLKSKWWLERNEGPQIAIAN